MRVPIAAQFLLGLVCLNGTLLCGVEAHYCLHLTANVEIRTGDVVTTKPYGEKSWCGLNQGKFLAVSNTKLLYLQCSWNAQDPAKAKVTIFDVSKLSYRSEPIIFHSTEECIIKRGKQVQADRLAALANRLSEVIVPYDRTDCNAQHYFQYLLQGKVDNENKTGVTCPVFSTFTDAKSVQSNDFRLSDKNNYYNWPVSSFWIFNPGGELTVAESKTTWNPPSAQFIGSTRSASGNSSRWGSGSFRGLRRRIAAGKSSNASGKSSNASKTQRQIDTASSFRGGGGGGWGNPTNPSGTGGKTPTSYPAGAYPYAHGQNTSAASGPRPPIIYSALAGPARAAYRMFGNGQ